MNTLMDVPRTDNAFPGQKISAPPLADSKVLQKVASGATMQHKSANDKPYALFSKGLWRDVIGIIDYRAREFE